ncbi:MAG TPA: hypothetical protein VGP44_04410 [Gemmatimonadales bacterium]|nr:hypothetical protein [Gemmatimonadales bacterium]
MTPPKPEPGAHVRLFLVSRRALDGVLGADLGGGFVSFRGDRTGEVERVRWEAVYSYHRLDPRGHRLPVQPELPLELEGRS